MKHKRLKEEAVKWLATLLNVPQSRVKTEVPINGRIADVFCDGCIVECGRTRTRRLEDFHKSGCTVFRWRYGAISPEHWTPSISHSIGYNVVASFGLRPSSIEDVDSAILEEAISYNSQHRLVSDSELRRRFAQYIVDTF